MASTYNRGTRAKPRWYASVELLDGSWKAYPAHALDKATADRIAAEMQPRADRGLPPVEKVQKRQKVAELPELWMAGLTNRTREQDKGRDPLSDQLSGLRTTRSSNSWQIGSKLQKDPSGSPLNNSASNSVLNLLSP
jgi:hypothetical protein